MAIAQHITQINLKPEQERTPQEKLACNENLALYLALPHICEHMASASGFVRSAKDCLKCEYYSKFPEISSGNSFRRQGFPFGKSPSKSSSEIFAQWRRPYKSPPLNQAYPDLCLCQPFPFTTIFEAKYFNKESNSAAEEAIVSGVREVAYYRGLPWDYDYGCLLAYDSSSGSYLKNAWSSVGAKRLFWEDANIFVMVVRGVRGEAIPR
jgi:hypothetical protein